MQFISRTSTLPDPKKIVKELAGEDHDFFDIGMVFTSGLEKSEIEELVDLLRKNLRVKTLIGCTCAGIIGNDVEIEHKIATTIILARLPEVKITPFSMTQMQLEQLNKPDDWYNFFEIFPNEKPTFLTFPDPFVFDMNQFLFKIENAFPKVPIVGGIASAANQPRENVLFINETLSILHRLYELYHPYTALLP